MASLHKYKMATRDIMLGDLVSTCILLFQVLTGIFGDRDDVPNIVIVLTDGGTPVNQQQMLSRERDITNNNAVIIAVGISQNAQSDDLRSIATDSDSVLSIGRT